MKCLDCSIKLNDKNWGKGNKEKSWYLCKSCHCKRAKRWRKENYHVVKLNNIKARAIIERHKWYISKDIGYCLITSPCAYCGSIPEKLNGLDRVDSNKEYTVNNVVPCCKWCNWAKNTMTVEQFKNHINKIYNYIIKE